MTEVAGTSILGVPPSDRSGWHLDPGCSEDANGIAAVKVNGDPVSVLDGAFTTDVELLEGTNPIRVEVRDQAGNVSRQTRQVDRMVTPSISIDAPLNRSLVLSSSVLVEGSVDDPGVAVVVNGVPAIVTGATFAASIPIAEGLTLLTATAIDGQGRSSTATVSVVRDSTPPVVVLSSPTAGAVIRQPTISVAGVVNDTASGYQGIEPITVTVNGITTPVENRSFLLPDLPLTPGDNPITAVATDHAGNMAQARVVVHFDDSPGPRLASVSGNHQSAVVGKPLPQPLIVELVDLAGQPLPGEQIHFAVIAGNGSLDGDKRQVIVSTDAAGRASVDFRLGSRAGGGTHRVLARASDSGLTVELSASATAAEPAHLLVDSGDSQVGLAGQPLPMPFSTVVTDASFNRLAGVDVLFRVIRGGGVFDDGSQEKIVTSDSQGAASAVLTLGPAEGVANNVVWAMLGPGPDDPLAGFAASGRVAGDPAETAIVGLVLDNTDRPVPGVTVQVVESGQTAQADASGFFRLPSAPVGTVHLHVDGSTATVPGVWSSLEFVLTTIPGRDNDLGRPIYTLPIDVERGLAVSATTGGTLTLPEFPGLGLEIEPGAVTFADGGHSGVVSVTLVHSDKVPMVPNFSQQPRFVITVQPAGAVFDPPARLSFPNVDGLAPGQVTELYSFDHDLGRFVSIGPGAITEDSTTLVSLPGFGIVKAGWHCGGNPSGSGTTHDCPDCNACVENNCQSDPGQNGDECEDDGDSCTVDLCINGVCSHWNQRITSFGATGDGQRFIKMFLGGCVDFRTVAETQHCEIDSYSWEFKEGVTSSDPTPTACYGDIGVFPWRVEASCGECADNGDFGVVKIECPGIDITGMDPDVGFLSPGCPTTFLAETSPAGFNIKWRLPSGGSLDGEATIDASGELAIASTAPSGTVTVEAAAGGNFDESACVATTSAQVFSAPGLPKGPWDLNPSEFMWGFMNPLCLRRHQNIAEVAREATNEVFTCGTRDGEVGNAFQHAFVNCLFSVTCGPADAEGFWSAHEDSTHSNNAHQARMDFHNNEVGRRVGQKLGLGATADQCSAEILGALFNDELRWLPPNPTRCPGFEKNLPPASPCIREDRGFR